MKTSSVRSNSTLDRLADRVAPAGSDRRAECLGGVGSVAHALKDRTQNHHQPNDDEPQTDGRRRTALGDDRQPADRE